MERFARPGGLQNLVTTKSSVCDNLHLCDTPAIATRVLDRLPRTMLVIRRVLTELTIRALGGSGYKA